MSFDIIFEASAEAARVATADDLRRILRPHLGEDDGNSLILDDGSSITYGGHRAFEGSKTLIWNRPGIDFAWDVTFELLRDFDYFLVWPNCQSALVARPDVRLSSDYSDLARVAVGSPKEIVEFMQNEEELLMRELRANGYESPQ